MFDLPGIEIPSFDIPKVDLPPTIKNVSSSLNNATKAVAVVAGESCDIFNTMSSMMDDVIAEAGKVAESAIGAVMNAMNTVASKIEAGAKKLQDLGNRAYAKCSKLLSDVIEKITSGSGSLFDFNEVKNKITAIMGKVATVYNKVETFISEKLGYINDVISDITNKVSQVVDNVVEAINDVKNKLAEVVAGISTATCRLMSGIITGMGNGVSSGLQGINNMIKGNPVSTEAEGPDSLASKTKESINNFKNVSDNSKATTDGLNGQANQVNGAFDSAINAQTSDINELEIMIA